LSNYSITFALKRGKVRLQSESAAMRGHGEATGV
jgi:hypothetical protein